MLSLPENFETYAEARKAGFLRMKTDKKIHNTILELTSVRPHPKLL